MNPSRSASPVVIETPLSSPCSERSWSLASSKTSWSDEISASVKSSSPAASLDDEPEDILVLIHPPEGTRRVETPDGPVLKKVTLTERALAKIRAFSQFVSDAVSLCNNFLGEKLRAARRFVTDRILRLDPIREEMRPLRDNLAVHGYPIGDLQSALREANSALGPLANRVDHAWVQTVVEGRLLSSFALEPDLSSMDLTARERGMQNFCRALRYIMLLATSPALCESSRRWTGWSSRKENLASWADGFAALSLPARTPSDFFFAHVPGSFSLREGVLFIKALSGGPDGGVTAKNAERLLAFLAPAGGILHERLSALLELSDTERWRFLGGVGGFSSNADTLMMAAIVQQKRDREDRLFARVLAGVGDLNSKTEIEIKDHLDRFLEFSHDRRTAWLERLVCLPPELRAHLIFEKPRESRSLLALETLAAEHQYSERFDGSLRAFGE